MPYYPLQSEAGEKYEIETYWEKMVADYARISILEVEELDYIDYLILRRDAFIYRLRQTEKGQEYLDDAYRLEQTKADKGALRERFGKGARKKEG